MGRFRRFIVEYVGNLRLPERADQPPRPASADRRTNWHARELMEWIKGQMEARGFPPAKKHELVNDVRRVLGQGGSTSHELSTNDATGEGTPDWVPETKGVSRDAPS